MNLLVRKVKIQNDPNKQITTTVLLKALYLKATLTLKFLTFAAKHFSKAELFGGSYQLYGAICCICETLQREIV